MQRAVKSNFLLPEEKKDKAYEALKSALSLDAQKPANFEEALEAVGWTCSSLDGCISGMYAKQESADSILLSEKIFKAVAPFVESGSFIQYAWGDCMRRWVFYEGEPFYDIATLTWRPGFITEEE